MSNIEDKVMKKYEHIFQLKLPIELDKDFLGLLIQTKTNIVEYDRTEDDAKVRNELILERIGFSFKKQLIENIQQKLLDMTDEDIEKLQLDRQTVEIKETEEITSELLYNA